MSKIGNCLIPVGRHAPGPLGQGRAAKSMTDTPDQGSIPFPLEMRLVIEFYAQ